MDKKLARLRRAKRTRRNIIEQGANRLVVHRTPRHIYAQLIAPNAEVIAAASTVETDYAAETATLTKNMILNKISLSLVAQANINESYK